MLCGFICCMFVQYLHKVVLFSLFYIKILLAFKEIKPFVFSIKFMFLHS